MNKVTFNRPMLSLLTLSHLFNDISQGAIPALLPFLVTEMGLSYVAISGLVLAWTVISSIAQPLLGFVTDRRPLYWMMPLGIFLSGVGVSLSGVMPSYSWLVVSVLICGFGSAVFHPVASGFTNFVSGERRATGMSLFAVGGNAGFAIGPLVITALVMGFGLPGTMGMIIPSMIVAAFLAFNLPKFNQIHIEHHASPARMVEKENQWGPFLRLSFVIILRSLFYSGLTTFIPIYLIHERGEAVPAGNAALTVMLVAGAIGTLLGGQLADRFGRRLVMVISLFAIIPCLVLFLLIHNWITFIFLALIGLFTVSTFSIGIVMGQEYLPRQIGVASGVTMGLAIGLGGFGVPLIGLIGDTYGITIALTSMLVLPILSALLVLTLPEEQKHNLFPQEAVQIS